MELLEGNPFDDWLIARSEVRAKEVSTNHTRPLVTLILRGKFGSIPDWLTEKIQQAGEEWCDMVAIRAIKASSLEELGIER